MRAAAEVLRDLAASPVVRGAASFWAARAELRLAQARAQLEPVAAAQAFRGAAASLPADPFVRRTCAGCYVL